MQRARLGVAAWLVSVLLACAGGPTDSPPAPKASEVHEEARLDGTTHHVLESRYVDQAFSIDVWQPIGVAGPLPVVYVLDGNTMFAMAYQMAMPMIYAGDIPPVILVGIGYEVSSPVDVVALRSRDLLPTPDPGFADEMAQSGFPIPEGVEPGGADAFLQFIGKELKPFVASRYPVNPDDETLIGYSYGGTFAFHVLVNSPGTFERYLVGSPVLARDNAELVADEARYATRHDSLDAHVFLSAGEYEVENGILAPTEAMMKTLRGRNYVGLTLETHVFSEETHESAIGPTISRGLRSVFGSWPRAVAKSPK